MRVRLWRNATQTVFGAGAARAPVMLIGEQPGDREDRAEKPFVGPAGQVLDRALAEAGIDPKRTYKTNVVKHFKWKPRGKRRIHQKPSKAEVEACVEHLVLERRGRTWGEEEPASLVEHDLILLRRDLDQLHRGRRAGLAGTASRARATRRPPPIVAAAAG